MKKQLGEVIRSLRKQQNITQERLAEYLGVSFQAVSKWENGLAYPDITLIPKLAGFFQTTTDVLFDMESEDLKRRQEEFEDTYAVYCQEGQIAQRLALMQEALKIFPRNFQFMMNLAETMDAYASGTSEQKSQYSQKSYSIQVQNLCLRVLDDCTEDMQRHRALRLLCITYADAGRIQEALALADTSASIDSTREILLEYILSGSEKIQQTQNNLLEYIDHAATALVNLAFRNEYGLSKKLPPEEKIRYIKAANQLYHTIMPDGNYQFYHRIVGWNYRRLGELYLLLNDLEEAYRCFVCAEQEADAYDNLTEHRYTAPFVNQLTYQPTAYTKSWIGSENGMLLYRLNELEQYFHGDSRFIQMRQRLEEKTKDEPDIRIE